MMMMLSAVRVLGLILIISHPLRAYFFVQFLCLQFNNNNNEMWKTPSYEVPDVLTRTAQSDLTSDKVEALPLSSERDNGIFIVAN